jgi:hypothetical protein
MKPGRRFVLIAAALFMATAAVVIADIRTIQPTGLTVHEWGTFTSVAGENGSAMDWDVLGGKDDLSRFVNDRGYRGLQVATYGHGSHGDPGPLLL